MRPGLQVGLEAVHEPLEDVAVVAVLGRRDLLRRAGESGQQVAGQQGDSGAAGGDRAEVADEGRVIAGAVVLVQAPVVDGGDRHHRGVDQRGVRQGRVPAESRPAQRGDPGVDDRRQAGEDGAVQQQPPGRARVVGQDGAQRVERLAGPLPPRHDVGRQVHEGEDPLDDAAAQGLAPAHVVVDDRGGDAEPSAQIAQRPRGQAVAARELDGGVDHLVRVEPGVVAVPPAGPAPAARHLRPLVAAPVPPGAGRRPRLPGAVPAVAPALVRLLPTAPGRAAAAGRGRKGGSRISSDPVA